MGMAAGPAAGSACPVPRGRRVGARASASTEAFSPRDFRRALNKSDAYNRRGFGHEEAVKGIMEKDFTSSLIQEMREDPGKQVTRGNVTVRLADSYGFCWGVERAIQIAFEARIQYPTDKIHITNEIIHNPGVNQNLSDMGVEFIEVDAATGAKDFSKVAPGDVVILPAFGASVQEMKLLAENGNKIVDTTCPWVSKVWNAVDKYDRNGHTSVLHGKYAHEESIATASFAGTYLIIKDMKEAEYVADYILHGGDRDAFLAKFSKAVSPGFDPDVHLDKIGVSNQTTMLKGETEAIAKFLENTMMKKFGVEHVAEHYMMQDTICDATQERQDAMYSLVDDASLDLMLVVGGYNSSNTSHLQEIAEGKGLPSYWVDNEKRLTGLNVIEHLTFDHQLLTSEGWLKPGPLKIGITSGASTPDKSMDRVLEEIFRQKAIIDAQ